MQVICPLKVDTLADVQHTVVVEDLGVPETHLYLALERWLRGESFKTAVSSPRRPKRFKRGESDPRCNRFVVRISV